MPFVKDPPKPSVTYAGVRFFRLGQLVLQAGSTLKHTKGGSSTRSDVYKGGEAVVRSAIPQIDDAHPTGPTMTVTAFDFITEEGGQASLTITYEGIYSPTGIEFNLPTYSLDQSATSEPIATHAKWVEDIGGTADAPKNNAQYDDEKRHFIGFPADAPNRLGGVTEYYAPSAHYKEHRILSSPPTGKVGVIQAPPGDVEVEGMGEGANWLANEISYTQKGAVFEVTRGWLLSAAGGWNTLIYGT